LSPDGRLARSCKEGRGESMRLIQKGLAVGLVIVAAVAPFAPEILGIRNG